jgi:hypothetical protein
MILFGKWRNQRLTISDKPNCLTVSLEDDAQTTVFSFDYAGRLWTALVDGISYRRGLDGKTVAKWQPAPGMRDRRWLTRSEASALEERARRIASDLAQDIRRGNPDITSNNPPSDRALSGLGRAALFTQERVQQDLARYRQVYQPVGILPPDQYMAVVLQITEGCSFNTCTFCNFYRDRRFRIKPPADFETHIKMVRDFLGEGLSLRRTIFLGDANALVTPMTRLAPLIEHIHTQLNVEEMGGLYAFLDGFSAEKKTPQDYRQLSTLGLKRIYIGMESGSSHLLDFLKKPGGASDVLHAVRSIKQGGIPVGVIILLGAGGREFAAEHIRETVSVLNRMELDADDLVYFSELIESEGLEYTRQAYEANLHPLSPQERIEQGERIEDQLRFDPSRGYPHISRYDIREFVY